MKPNKSDLYLIWKAMMKRYEDINVQDLSTLYKAFTKVIDKGPGLKDH